MFNRKEKPSDVGDVDGGEGRGVPLPGRDDRPPTGYRDVAQDEPELTDDELGWDEDDPADRRRDPLRK